MHIVDMTEAAEQLDRLIDRAVVGDDITIAREGVPVARLEPVPVRSSEPRPLGWLDVPGYWMSDDFDEPVDADLWG